MKIDDSWRCAPALQQPVYPDPQELQKVVADLETRPPLVFAGEVDRLKQQIALAAKGESFILMGGDCAETFADSNADQIRLKIQTILQMAIVLTYGGAIPIVKMGRMAGQYAKPRSRAVEVRDGVTLPVYRGDAVNSHEFTASARTPDPRRLLEMYTHSASTINLIRAFTQGGYADIREVHRWNKGFTKNPAYARFEKLAGGVDHALRFMRAAGVDFETLRTVDFYSAHEALLLEYEHALTRVDSRTSNVYNTSAHMLWIGERTRDPQGAHVQMLAHVANPIGIKIGPGAASSDIGRLLDELNPQGEPGRITLITRFGADQVADKLPPLIEFVRADGREVTWLADPMHGNTITTATGLKTRVFGTILREVEEFFRVHRLMGSVPGGIHVELTGDDVTEVMGGGEPISEDDLTDRYETLVDPRLNHQQSLELAFLVAELLNPTLDVD